MATQKVSDNKVDLTEVLNSIRTATSQQYKDKDGVPYSTVPIKRLKGWLLDLESFCAMSNDKDATSMALQEARDQVTALMHAAAGRESRMAELEDLVRANDKARAAAAAEQAKSIAALRAKIASETVERAELEKTKAETIKALAAAEKARAQPEAKYSPDTASALTKEVHGLKDDLRACDERLARTRAALSASNVALDSAHKIVAAKTKALEEAKAEQAIFVKQLAAARLGNVDLFLEEDVDYAKLELVFGATGVAKLKKVLAIQSWDVRGRIQALTGFFANATKASQTRFAAFVKMLNYALDVLKTSTTTWVAILAPWVNVILKDIVMFELKPVSVYRTDLKAKIDAVKAIGPGASAGAKLHKAGATTARPEWSSVARQRRDRVYSLVARATAKAKALASAVAATLTSGVRKTASGLARVGRFIARVPHFAKVTVLTLVVFVKGAEGTDHKHAADGDEPPATGEDGPITMVDTSVAAE